MHAIDIRVGTDRGDLGACRLISLDPDGVRVGLAPGALPHGPRSARFCAGEDDVGTLRFTLAAPVGGASPTAGIFSRRVVRAR